MTYADDDEDWSRKVAQRYHSRCAWPGCSSTFGLGAHHIIKRGIIVLRLVLENGVLLCAKHHTFVEYIKNTPKYDKVISLLVSSRRYKELVAVRDDYLLDIAPTKDSNDALEASELEL